jgi:hypothetical protein
LDLLLLFLTGPSVVVMTVTAAPFLAFALLCGCGLVTSLVVDLCPLLITTLMIRGLVAFHLAQLALHGIERPAPRHATPQARIVNGCEDEAERIHLQMALSGVLLGKGNARLGQMVLAGL